MVGGEIGVVPEKSSYFIVFCKIEVSTRFITISPMNSAMGSEVRKFECFAAISRIGREITNWMGTSENAWKSKRNNDSEIPNLTGYSSISQTTTFCSQEVQYQVISEQNGTSSSKMLSVLQKQGESLIHHYQLCGHLWASVKSRA